MKIVCENCGAKYSIADEKVKGKVFKIRCKKCSESILVRGDTPKAESQPEPRQMLSSPPEEEGEAETRVFDYGAGKGQLASVGAEPIWHIVVDDQQQGPYTEAQIKEYISAGSITTDTLIWREGFDDWMSVRDVPEFGAMAQPAMMGSNEALFDEQPTAYRGGGALFDEQPGGGGLFSSGGSASPFDSGGGLFGDSAPSGDVFSSTAPEAAVSDGGLFGDSGGGRIGGDIFAAKEPMPATSGEGIFSTRREEPMAHQQQPGPRVKAEQAMLTGQRNENSVLFSLSNLQALAAAPSKDPSGGASDAGFSGLGAASTGEEASGLIDIRSLAGSISTAEQNDSVDDLISMSAGGFSPALGAPVLAAQNEGMSSTMKIGIIAGGIAALVLIVVVLVIVLSGDDEARTQSEAQILALQRQIEELTKKGGNTEAIAALEAQIKAKEKQAGDQGTARTDEEGADGKDDDKAASSGEGSKARKSTGGSSKSSSSRTSRTSGSSSSSSSSSGGGSKSSGSSQSSSSSSSGSSSTPSPKPKSSGSSELDDLLGGASPSKPKPKPASSSEPKSSGGESSAKASLSRADVQTGMANVAPAVQRCGQGKGGTITMNVMIGKTGRVSSASAVGAFAGTPIGSCAARAVRRAKFPASQQTLNVKYPFKL